MMKISFVKKSVVLWVMAMFSLVAIPLQYVAAAEESDEIIYLDTVDIKYAYVIFDNERKAAIKIIHD